MIATLAAPLALDADALCRCGHPRKQHDPLGQVEHISGRCNAWGCRCGLFRAASKPANQNDTRRPSSAGVEGAK